MKRDAQSCSRTWMVFNRQIFAPEINISMKFIIIVGMAHSGTTILTRTLSQHPSIICYRSGNEAWLYENDALAAGVAAPIFEFAAKQSAPYLLMKRPWVDHRPNFLLANFPDAYYLYTQREKEEIFKSWAKPDSMVDQAARTDRNIQDGKYNDSLEMSRCLEARVPHFLRIKHEELCYNPDGIFKQITELIGLSYFNFNFVEINKRVDIKRLLRLRQKLRRPIF